MPKPMSKSKLAEALAKADELNNAFDRLESKVAALVEYVTSQPSVK